MASIDDLWWKNQKQPDGSKKKVKSARYGKGRRYLARGRGPDGKPYSQAWDLKSEAQVYIDQMEASKHTGTFHVPTRGRVKLAPFGQTWIDSLALDPSTRIIYEGAWRNHILPHLGGHPLSDISPIVIREWWVGLNLSLSTIHTAYKVLLMIMEAAKEDRRIPENAAKSKTARPPGVPARHVVPWPRSLVLGVRAGMPDRYQLTVDMGRACGLRQGEVFGLSVEDIGHDVIHVRQQVKLLHGKMIFGLPKHDKTRQVPLHPVVAERIKQHLKAFPPRVVTLPWEELDGRPISLQLLFTTRESKPLNRNYFNTYLWKPALVSAGIKLPKTEAGRWGADRDNGFRALRTYFASTQLHNGTSIRALASYLGHADPAFTLRIYTHLMPESAGVAVAAVGTDYAGEGGPDLRPPRGKRVQRWPSARNRILRCATEMQ